MSILIIATRNRHKLAEIRAILGNQFRYLTLNDFPNAPPIKEDADTFAGNAKKKAVQFAQWLSQFANRELRIANSNEMFLLGDDSGLEVDALGGAPGVLSARFASEDFRNQQNSPDDANNAKLLHLLEGVPLEKRQARFHCVIALVPFGIAGVGQRSELCSASGFELLTELFEGRCEGRIGFGPRGDGGFGYDPLFVPNGFEVSFAELGEAIKNQLSHRARALAKLRERLAGLK